MRFNEEGLASGLRYHIGFMYLFAPLLDPIAGDPNFLNDDRMHVTMAKGRAVEVRVRAKETVKLGGLDVTNRTANSIMVKKTADGLVVTNCCLEEQGM